MNNAPKNNKDPFGNDPRLLALAERIMSLRIEKKISQEQLAALAGIPQSQVSKIERGIIGEPGVWTLSDIAKALDVSVEELLKPIKFPPKNLKSIAWEKLAQGRPTTIAITSPTGGSGKSSTSINLGALAAHQMNKGPKDSNPVKVLVLDGDIAGGTLAMRVAGMETPGIVELINAMNDGKAPEKFEDLRNLCLLQNQQTPELFILPAPDNPDAANDVMADDCEALLKYLAQFFSLIVIDCGTEMHANYNQAWINQADATYVLTYPESANLKKTHKFIEYMSRPRPSRDGSIRAPIANKENVQIVVMRSDMDWGVADMPKLIQNFFPTFAAKQVLYFHDLNKEMMKANNRAEFLALSKSQAGRVFRGDINHIIARLLKHLGK